MLPMQLQKVFDLFQLLSDDELSLYYQGEIRDDITAQLIALNDGIGKERQAGFGLKRKVAFVIAECFQNMVRHQEVPEIWNRTNYRPAMFSLRQQNDVYQIASANLVKSEHVDTLIWYLKELVHRDGASLKALYRELLPQSEVSEKGGAGLGLIELARKSNQQFNYSFNYVNFYLSQFFFQLQLNGTQQPLQPISQFQAMYDLLLTDRILLVYKSDFTQDSMMPVLEMIEANLQWKNKDITLRKTVLYVMVEMFQNIVKHAARYNNRQEGVLMITLGEDGAFNLITGNLVSNENVQEIDGYLSQLNALDKLALQQRYMEELRNSGPRDKGGAGLGLIETARYCRKSFEYSFFPYGQEHAFFSLRIQV